MDRTSFYNQTTVNNVVEIDFLYHNLSKFVPKYRMAVYRVTAIDIQRPDLISQRMYGTTDFWWFILLVNNIQNPFMDLSVGDLLNIPNVLDIYDFYKKYATF